MQGKYEQELSTLTLGCSFILVCFTLLFSKFLFNFQNVLYYIKVNLVYATINYMNKCFLLPRHRVEIFCLFSNLTHLFPPISRTKSYAMSKHYNLYTERYTLITCKSKYNTTNHPYFRFIFIFLILVISFTYLHYLI